MSKIGDSKKLFITNTRKGKFEDVTFHAIIKYQFNEAERSSILEQLGKKHHDVTYNVPKPSSHLNIRKHQTFLDPKFSLSYEVQFIVEGLKKYVSELNQFVKINLRFEQCMLLGNLDVCLDILDEIDEKLGHSVYSLIAEYYINEVGGRQDLNYALLNTLTEGKADAKVMIIMNLTRRRIDNAVSSLSYEGTIDQHKKLYKGENADKYIDYINFTFNKVDYSKISNYAFVLNFDADFSIIDRYRTFKKIVPLILNDKDVDQAEKDKIIAACHDLSLYVNDTFWDNFNALYTGGMGPFSDRSEFHEIQDLLFESEYVAVVNQCFVVLQKNPHYSELYVPFIQSLIQTEQDLNSFFTAEHPLREILEPMKSVLEKKDNYLVDRERLLKKFYSINHFDYSNHILEFVTNELNISVDAPVQLISFLNSTILRYNAFKLFDSTDRLLNILKANPFKTEKFLTSLIIGVPIKTIGQSYLSLKVEVGYYGKNGLYENALAKLMEIYQESDVFVKMHDFMRTWVRRNLIQCLISLDRLGEAADIISDAFFEKKFPYEHYIDSRLFLQLSNPFEERFADHISIPIIFEIYHLPPDSVYDVVANFLISNDVYVPSELLRFSDKWPSEIFHYFLEKCCQKENIQDSPFLKSIASLDEERIKILNYLKEINHQRKTEYNLEIRDITQETSLRKGLLHIHESRIYADVQSISKVHNIQPKELFDTYITFTNLQMSNVSVMNLQEFYEPNKGNYAYYFKELLSKDQVENYDYHRDHMDDNVVEVPELKYQYFTVLFGHLKNLFIYDEDYGFKSFLSMRIRHGTFTNVLRMVFEKHNLISSKEGESDKYQDIVYWLKLITSPEKSSDLQLLLHEFSLQIDTNIERGLSWLVIKNDSDKNSQGYFDFEFSEKELFFIFRNRIGRITKFEEFQSEIFQIFFERLEECLASLREQIAITLNNSFVSLMDELQQRVNFITLEDGEQALINKTIINCRTEIQSIIVQIGNWFRVSKNKYIEEFPIDLILDTIRNYINTIYANALDIAMLTTEVSCSTNIKGKYFISFGDLFITIYDNIIRKNKELKEHLKIDIKIFEEAGMLNITVFNNIAEGTNVQDLLKSIEDAKIKISNYQNGTDVGFERGSGFVKICKSVAVDLERKNYTVTPHYHNGIFLVNVTFETENLFA